MASFYSDPAVGGDGTTTTDDANPTTGLANYGWTTRFIPAFVQLVAIATWVKNRALDVLGYANAAAASQAAAAASAASAASAPGTTATSTSSVVVGSGSKSFTIQTGKSLVPGQWLVAADQAAPTTNWMLLQISSYNSGTGALVGTVGATDFAGSGTISAWNLALSAPKGPAGPAGPVYTERTGNFTATSNAGNRINGNNITALLPAAPAVDDVVHFVAGNLTFTGFTVGRNGLKIMELNEDMTVGVTYFPFALRYTGAATGWVFSE